MVSVVTIVPTEALLGSPLKVRIVRGMEAAMRTLAVDLMRYLVFVRKVR